MWIAPAGARGPTGSARGSGAGSQPGVGPRLSARVVARRPVPGHLGRLASFHPRSKRRRRAEVARQFDHRRCGRQRRLAAHHAGARGHGLLQCQPGGARCRRVDPARTCASRRQGAAAGRSGRRWRRRRRNRPCVSWLPGPGQDAVRWPAPAMLGAAAPKTSPPTTSSRQAVRPWTPVHAAPHAPAPAAPWPVQVGDRAREVVAPARSATSRAPVEADRARMRRWFGNRVPKCSRRWRPATRWSTP